MHSIRFRLTARYFLITAALLLLFGVSAWIAIRVSLDATVDHTLSVRIADVDDFLDKELTVGPAELLDEFREQTQLGLAGGLFRVIDERGSVLYRSPRFPERQPAGTAGAAIVFETTGSGIEHMRVASRSVQVRGHQFKIAVAEPLYELDESLGHFEDTMMILGPLFVLIASMVGYWMSARALAPVDRLTRDARHISINNLSERLQVPRAKDELQALALTLNQMLERIDQAVRRMMQFTADASHELRAPVTLIRTAAEFSLRRERSREELMDALRIVLRESERTSRLIDDLLEIARADSATEGPLLTPVDLAQLAREAAGQATTLAAGKNIRVHAAIQTGSIFVAGDEPALSRLFLLLLDNAVKYTPENGEIQFHLSIKEVRVEAGIRDTGIGIAEADLPHIFDRFWRADKVRSRNRGGAGLGLSIAKQIVERHGGEIEVHSSAGNGSEFIVYLPRIVHDEHAVAETTEAAR